MKRELLPCVRFDHLSDKTLVALSKDQLSGFEGRGLVKGFEATVIEALC